MRQTRKSRKRPILLPLLLLLLLLVSRFRRQPTRLPRPWDSLGKNTGVGCHFLLQCMKVKSESEVAQLCPTLTDPMDCSLPGSSSMGFSRQECWSGVPLPSPEKDPYIHVKCTQSCLTLWNPWTVACQAPLSVEFSRQEY